MVLQEKRERQFDIFVAYIEATLYPSFIYSCSAGKWMRSGSSLEFKV